MRRTSLVAAGVGFAPAFLVTCAGVIALSLFGPAPPWRRAGQPVAFNHQKHVKELGLECSTCHVTVETEAFAGLPDAALCASCHEEPQGKSAEEASLVALLKAGKPLDWTPLFRQPAHVNYSHRLHVVVAKIECKTCHGSIAQTTAPPDRVRKLRMDDCLGCHKGRKAVTSCTECHR